MVIRRYTLALFIILIFRNFTAAQEIIPLTENLLDQKVQTNRTDTVPTLDKDDPALDKIVDIRKQFEKQNQTYSIPAPPAEKLLRFLKKDEAELSPEALYWVNWVRDPDTRFDPSVTFKDTMIVNPLFMPLVFKGGLLPDDLELYNKNLTDSIRPQFSWYRPDTLFREEMAKQKMEKMAYDYVRTNYPQYFRYTVWDLPDDVVETETLVKKPHEVKLITVENEADFSDLSAPAKFIPERRYWTSHFESAIQFAQNYISPNWHKGGISALNLSNREYFVYNYKKDKIQFTNELEIKTNVFTAPKDTLHDYKIGDDVFRIHSNIGYKAFNKWFYTFDFTFQTQLFNNYQENKDIKQAAFLAPFSINLGLGMKYDLDRKFQKRHKKLTMSVNLAPISYTFMYSVLKNKIDLSRHGFKKDEETGEYSNKLSQFGSTINATLTFQFNRNVSWYSRFYYFTSYDRMLGEFENRLTMAISRFFSTNISLNLRYDDAVAKNEDFDSYLQINELLSFGFNYKW